jgi:hypothetical protein
MRDCIRPDLATPAPDNFERRSRVGFGIVLIALGAIVTLVAMYYAFWLTLAYIVVHVLSKHV